LQVQVPMDVVLAKTLFAKEKEGCTEYQHLSVLNTKGVL
jgi:hypothetical protein